MADFIEKDKAIDALNKALFAYEDETEERFKNDPELDITDWFFHRIFVQSMNGIDRQTILDLPSESVRPVVYCKDCVHFVRGELFGDMVCDYHYRHHYHAEPNEFCSHAEVREGKDNANLH